MQACDDKPLFVTSTRRSGASGVINFRSGQRKNVLKVSLDDFLRTKNALNTILLMNRENNMNLNFSSASIDLPELEDRVRLTSMRGSKLAMNANPTNLPATASGGRKIPLDRVPRATRESSTAPSEPSPLVDEKMRMIDSLNFAFQTGQSHIFDVQLRATPPANLA